MSEPEHLTKSLDYFMAFLDEHRRCSDLNAGAIVTKYIDDKEFQDTTFAEMARRIYDEIRAGGQVSG